MLEDQNETISDLRSKLEEEVEAFSVRESRWRVKLDDAAALAEEVNTSHP
jgi:hypothetical protein